MFCCVSSSPSASPILATVSPVCTSTIELVKASYLNVPYLSIHQSLNTFSPGFPNAASIKASADPPTSGSTMSYKAFSPAPKTSSIATPTALPVTPAAVAAKFKKLPNLAATLLSAFIISIHAVPIDLVNLP